ncbi:pirin family protein [Shewanella sp. SW36]|uniref:pirin family protein n=1 Tax=Shewanella TaxID=22 RepID=UPI0021DA6E47|nr:MULTISPECIES: pirin family protein [unclassified Shewanella]MCU7974659.1 pirin family protein [Shewanella sp. SW36]MCU7990047.1 pirin family protein [Shewanella sp. SW1]MCU8015330.1 pirin family protein [Shewanella sp. SM72]MCU8051978.1 pirin family protein [Shewanella sp. SM43]
MKVLSQFSAKAAMDGDGVNIRRVADFVTTKFDPFLMIDEIKSDDEQDFIGGFPAHPHRGMETFTYIRKGGFEHRDQMGNVKSIRAGDVQWMSTGFGVVHSEMPLADAVDGLHGFQIWVNMPAKDKLRPAKYQDTAGSASVEVANDTGASLKALAGDWGFKDQPLISAAIQGLAGEAAIADLSLSPNAEATLDLSQHEFVALYLYQGDLYKSDSSKGEDSQWSSASNQHHQGEFLVLDSQSVLKLKADERGAGMLLFAGKPIREKIVQMGPFVMNTQAEIQQAIRDYQDGRFGQIA